VHRAATTALRYPCLLEIEVMHPRYHRKDHRTGFSVNLTVNTGYE
jgi:hypothetical protein